MANNTNQGELQKWLRSQTGSASDFNGDLMAYFKLEGFDTTFGITGCLYKYLKAQLSLVGDYALPDLQYRFARAQGKDNWNSVVSLVLSSDFLFVDNTNFFFADGTNFTFIN